MWFAVDQINNDLKYLPDLTIGYEVRDSNNDAIIGFIEAIDITIHYDSINTTPPILGPAYTYICHPSSSYSAITRNHSNTTY